MEFELKKLSSEAVPAALERAERYRLLNEPLQAESICLDILTLEPGNQQALVGLLLALSEQFGENITEKLDRAWSILPKLSDAYQQAYYQGIIWERLGNARIRRGGTGAGASAYHPLREAMDHYEKAMNFAIPGNDDAILRWNTCARVIMQNPDIRPDPENEPAQAWEHDEAGSRIADA